MKTFENITLSVLTVLFSFFIYIICDQIMNNDPPQEIIGSIVIESGLLISLIGSLIYPRIKNK